MANRIVTVFGGTGFLGGCVVRRLLAQNLSVRIASRHPERLPSSAKGAALQSIRADINDEGAIASAISGTYGVVNAVSLYVERGTETFHAVHVKAAERLARQAQRAGVERFVHVSGIGANTTSSSPYIRRRGEGELAVQAAFANASIVRPAVMFARNDAFLNTLVRLLKRLPAYPMFGRGSTRLQPVHVEDVAEAIARILQLTAANPVTYELGGPRVFSYEELLTLIANRLSKKPLLLSLPFPVWHSLARIAEILPEPPLTRNQVELMEVDTVAAAGMRGFDALGIAPQPIEHALEQILAVAGG
jgi:NADH dehydrogenase